MVAGHGVRGEHGVLMAYYPFSPQMGCKYVLLGPQGSRAVFNDPTDADYVGGLTEDGITGLDSADVRESATELAGSDGGSHGDFYFGRRPITITGVVTGHSSHAGRDLRLAKLRRATNALRTDVLLQWQNNPTASTAPMQTWCRLQNRRITGAWNKSFQLGLVSEYAVLFSQAVRTANGSPVTVENQGDWAAFPLIRITGASSNPTVTVDSLGTDEGEMKLFMKNLNLAAGEAVEVDTLNHTATFVAGARNGQSANRYIDFDLTVRWPALHYGNSTVTLGGGGTLSLTWRDAWA